MSVVGVGNNEVIKNLKVGIMKDLHKSGLITQKQMEQAVKKINREILQSETSQNNQTNLDTASPILYNKDGFRKPRELAYKHYESR